MINVDGRGVEDAQDEEGKRGVCGIRLRVCSIYRGEEVCGGAARSSMARPLWCSKGQGDVRMSFLVSRRFWGA
jgi:hypothetical protein